MLILSINNGIHDSSVVVAEDYDILSAVHVERITRKKGDGSWAHIPTINAALQMAGVNVRDVQVFAMSQYGKAPKCYFNWGIWRTLGRNAEKLIGKKPSKIISHNRPFFNHAKLLQDIGVSPQAEFYFYNHHFAHALSALFFTHWDNALLYTADGGGDTTNYSCYHFDGEGMREYYGDRNWRGGDGVVKIPVDSVGNAYKAMTQALGYTPGRHEGKITGLAAYGEPDLYDEMSRYFWVEDSGRVCTSFNDFNADMNPFIQTLAMKTTRENAAASVQKLLETIILKSISIYLQKTKARKVGLAGGVFANVSLNRRIAELPEVDEVFIFPAMGDDGLAVGGLYQYLLERDGVEIWKSKRQQLETVYLGGNFDNEVAQTFNGKTKKLDGDPATVAAQLISQNKIVALYCGRMEFGPRALGARSILASATDKTINDTLNKRLTRTEFMPFAPAVLAEDAADVFEVNDTNRYAMRFMTITCAVREKWRNRIPAVVHVDGTARPQIVHEEDNPLYASILRHYKEATGIPVLINTSFNAHEEPIIHTPEECLNALLSGRVDYVATPGGVYEAVA